MGNRLNHKPKRDRKLLLHRRELAKFAGKASERGFTLVPTQRLFQERAGESRDRRRPRQAAPRQAAGPEERPRRIRDDGPRRQAAGGDRRASPCALPPWSSPRPRLCRYRLRAFGPALAAAGHSLDLHALPRTGGAGSTSPAPSATRTSSSSSGSCSPAGGRACCRQARRLWFDFDDAVWMRDSYAAKGFDSRKRAGPVRSDGPGRRSGRCRQRVSWRSTRPAGARAVRVIPTCVDVHRYPLARHDRSRAQTWSGSGRPAPSAGWRRRPDPGRHRRAGARGAAQARVRPILLIPRLPVVESPVVGGDRGDRDRRRRTSASVGCRTTPGAAGSAG